MKDSLYISSMDCPCAKVSFDLLELYNEHDRDYVTNDDLDELDGSLTFELEKSFETSQLKELTKNYTAAKEVIAAENIHSNTSITCV